MASVKCPQCGKEFRSEQALKIHVGRMHGAKRKGKKRATRAAVNCEICGRPFRMSMHLARHMKAAHAGVAAPAVSGKAAAVFTGIDVASLTIEQMLQLKRAVDGRLQEIGRLLRQAKI